MSLPLPTDIHIIIQMFESSEPDRDLNLILFFTLRVGREAGRSSTTNAEVKRMWIYICTFSYAFLA
jgi:hypothetical protein